MLPCPGDTKLTDGFLPSCATSRVSPASFPAESTASTVKTLISSRFTLTVIEKAPWPFASCERVSSGPVIVTVAPGSEAPLSVGCSTFVGLGIESNSRTIVVSLGPEESEQALSSARPRASTAVI